jgi:hypothetical protein
MGTKAFMVLSFGFFIKKFKHSGFLRRKEAGKEEQDGRRREEEAGGGRS